jgi:hypothetical protein
MDGTYFKVAGSPVNGSTCGKVLRKALDGEIDLSVVERNRGLRPYRTIKKVLREAEATHPMAHTCFLPSRAF